MKTITQLILLLTVIFVCNSTSQAQAPNISYAGGAKVYAVGSAITTITPTNSGGAFYTSGQVTSFAGTTTSGSTDATGTSARFFNPYAIAVDASGNVFVSDNSNNKIRKITAAGVVTTFAGSATNTAGSADGTGTAAGFSSPNGIALDAAGNLYVADGGNHKIRKITPAGVVTTLAGSATNTSGSADGTGSAASFNAPNGIAVDAAGSVYVGDKLNNKIRKITSAGVVTSLAGSTAGFADGTGTSAKFNSPSGVAVDASGNVYVADVSNNKIRKVTSAGVVTTLAGSTNGSVDGTGAAAKFTGPTGVTVDASGNVYVADKGNNKIRYVTSAGVVTTLAGSGGSGSADANGTSASFNGPSGIGYDVAGNLYVADFSNNKIRKIFYAGLIIYPALPAGLSFNYTTGAISGTPTVLTAATNYTVSAYNASGTSNAVINISTVNNNADLAALSISNGTLTSAFAAATTAYTDAVASNITAVTVTPTVSFAQATVQVQVNGGGYSTVSSGTASSSLSLNTGANTINVKVTAQDGTTIKTYTITVTRATSTPTGAAAQTFCAGSTLADVVVVGSAIKWYSVASNGSPLSNSTVLVDGTTYYASQTVNSLESDTRLAVTTTIKPVSTSTTNITICASELPYSWNGLTFNTAGTQTAHFTNSVGCDSAATLVLTVNPLPTASISGTSSVCINDAVPSITFTGATGTSPYTFTYTINGGANVTVTTTSGSSVTVPISSTSTVTSFVYNLVSVQDASSTTCSQSQTGTATITVNAPTTSDNNLSICPSALPFTWNGVIFNTAGTQTAHITNSNGCDSAATLTLNLKTNTTSNTSLAICLSALPYSWNGLTFNAAGTQTAHLTNSQGCDSAATLVLTIKVNSISNTNLSICSSALPFTWNGLTFNTSGSQTAHLTNSQGCDSAATLVLTVSSNNTITLTSAVGTNAQTKCINTAIASITYSTTGATNATVTGLPNGVTGNWSGNVVTIAGTPTQSGTFNYTVTLAGGCGTITANGSIIVTADNTISLTSAGGNNFQSLFFGGAITNITYNTTGATGASFAGLPTGVTGVWASNAITISGTPTVIGFFSFTITLTGGCGNVTSTGFISVNSNSNADLSSLVMSAGTLSPVFASGTTTYTANVSNATSSITITPTVSNVYATVTVNGTSVTSASASGAIALNVGSNVITTVVTAQNGTTKTYTLTVTRISLPPTISSFSPSSGFVGSFVTINGTNLSSVSTINIGGVTAVSISNDGTTIVAMVMPGAVIGVVSVTNNGGTATSLSNFTVNTSVPPASQQSGVLVGTGNVGPSEQGRAVALSADGNTALVTASKDDGSLGACWIFVRNGTTWTQQGPKLVGSGYNRETASGWDLQGSQGAAAISGDGNTVVIGGYYDDEQRGSIWVFTRTAGVWTQMGSKLVGTGSVTYHGSATKVNQGLSVAISADGNTIAEGTTNDNDIGAVWVFVRNGNTWTQQGSKLVGTGGTGFGQNIALSADGNTLATGGYLDGAGVGAVWVFTRNGITWSQQGSKLRGTGAVGASPLHGYSIALSSDGNTLIEGAPSDNASIGAAWAFTRSGGVWTQQGSKLVGTGYTGFSSQGYSVALSGDGNIAYVGGVGDNNNDGAVWIFVRSGTVWSQYGTKRVRKGSPNSNRNEAFSVAISADGNTGIIGAIGDNNNIGSSRVLYGPLSNNANLSDLIVSDGTLSPGFASSTLTYKDTVLNTTSTITVTPSVGNPYAYGSIKVNGIDVESGATSGAINLNVGNNSISMVVLAEDLITTKTYNLTVYRAPSTDATLSNLVLSNGSILSPGFASGTTSYTSTVTNTVSAITVTSSVNQANATIKVNGVTVASGVASGIIALSVGSNIITTVVTAQDGITTQTYTVTVIRLADATLSSLSSSTGTLSPTFTPATLFYSTLVNNATNSITVTPTVNNPLATVKVNGISVTSGTASGAIALNVGSNTVTIVVTAQDGATGTYTLTVTRASSDATLSALAISSGTLSPAFASGTNSYTASVANAITSITVTPTINQANATVKVNGVIVTSGIASGSIALNVGNNTITTVVTAQDPISTKTYTITVSRAPSANANLSSLFINSGSLSPSFVSTTTAYTKPVNDTISFISVTPTIADITATIQIRINGGAYSSITSGSASSLLALSVGINTIDVKVTAQDGTTVKTYTITTTRLASTNSNLAALTISAGTLSPVFASATTDYGDSVNNPVTSVTVTPTKSDFNATIQVQVNSGGFSTVASGSPSASLPLNVGSNTIEVKVTAQDASFKIYTITITRYAQPSISSIAPLTGTVGSLVTITGVGLQSATSVNIGGISSIPVSNTGTSLVVMVMTGTTAGTITFTNGSGTATSASSFTVIASTPPTLQQGSKLQATSGRRQGSSLAISADGNTAIVGAELDSAGGFVNPTYKGGAYIYVRTGATWTQQGSKLIGSGGDALDGQGNSVSISADGNTVLIGGFGNNHGIGAVWVFTRTGTTWTQQGSKIVMNGTNGETGFGFLTSLSADGNLALIVSKTNNDHVGTGFTFVRSGGVWTQQGNKIILPAYMNSINSLSLSADGKTAAFGLPYDNINASLVGSVSVYTRSGNNWTLQANLTGTGAVTAAQQGTSVSLSADGNTLMEGGLTDNTRVGAVWVFTRTGGVWTQQGNKLVASDYVDNLPIGTYISFGWSVSLSADGNTAVIGADQDNNLIGNAWVFTRSGGVWSQFGSRLQVSGLIQGANTNSVFGYSTSLSADGNTSIIGAWGDNNAIGSAYVFNGTASTNANLSSLTTSAGTLAPVFSSATTSYSTTVSASSITVTPTSSNAFATITVNGAGVASGTASGTIALNLGINTITTVVTAQDGISTKTYTMTVTRLSNNADLSNLTISSGTVSPVFASGTTAYTDTVSNGTTSITVTPTLADATASVQVKINGGSYATVTSGTASSAMSLNLGNNTISVKVTAQDATIKTYTVVVTRLLSNDASLSALSTSVGTLSPSFTSSTFAYNTTVSNATSSLKVTPTKSDANAVIQVRINGGSYAVVASGTASSNLGLNIGNNTIDVLVTAQDGTTTQTYTCTVLRPSNNANLAALDISAGSLSPAFASATTSYNVVLSVATTNSITVTPTKEEANALIELRINGGTYATVTSGNASSALALNMGSNTIDVRVTAQDGTVKTYTINVALQSNDANLSDLTVNTGSLSPAFDAAITSYSAGIVPNTTTAINIVATKSNANATIKMSVNGGAYTNGASGVVSVVALSPGINSIIFLITAEDGTTKSYTLAVERLCPTVILPLSVSIAADQNNVCPGTNVTFTATTVNGAVVVYQWKKNSFNVGTNIATYSDAGLLNNDTVWCVITNTNPCATPVTSTLTSNKVKMTFKAGAGVPVINTNSVRYNCTVGTSTGMACNYWNSTWSSSNPAVATVTYPGASGSSSTYINSVSGGSTVITVTITNTVTGCSSSSSTLYTVIPTTAGTISALGSICLNNTSTATSTVNGGIWKFNNNRVTVDSITGIFTGASVGSGTLSYIVTNALGCNATATKTITVLALPAIPVVSVLPAIPLQNSICNGSTFQFTGTPAGGVWTTTNSSIATITLGGLMQTVGLGSATLTYTISNVNGCTNSRLFPGTIISCFARGVNPVTEPSVTPQISLYPNPAKSAVSLQVDKLTGGGSIVITDMYGKSIKNYPLRQAQGDNRIKNSVVQTLDISTLSKGMYLVNVITREGKMTKKLVVE